MYKLVVLFFQLFISSFLWADSPILQEKLKELSNKELFELSKNGTLGKIANETPNGEQLNLKIFREEPFDLVTNQSYPSPSLPKIYLHLKAVSPEWVIDKDIQTLFKQFKDNLLQLGADTIIEESSKILSQRKANKEFGGLYYGFQFTPEDRDDRFYIEVDIKTEELISNIMKAENNIDLDELTTNEKMIIEKGKLSSEEMLELKKLKLASQVFSSNSPFKNTPGGWANNKKNPRNHVNTTPGGLSSNKKNPKNHVNKTSCPFTAYCGEHSRTSLEFLKQLENRGYLKHFLVGNQIVRDHIINNHAGVTIKNKRTGEIFVLDSWAVKGGQPIKIIPLSKWALWIMKGKSEIQNTCLTSILNRLSSPGNKK